MPESKRFPHSLSDISHTMQLAITILGCSQTDFISEILPALYDCQCHIIELRSSHLAGETIGYLLIEGNWNQVAKLENTLDGLKKRLPLFVNYKRPDKNPVNKDLMPYSLETISSDRGDVTQCVTTFLLERNIIINEMSGSRFQTSFIQTALFSAKFIIFIPTDIRLLSFREELLDFCDQMNIDAILEPIKR